MTDDRLKTTINVNILGAMPSRYLPAGYHPQAAQASTVERVQRAVAGLADLIDGYEFYYPHSLHEGNLDQVRRALGPHDIYAIASSIHLEPRFAAGGLVSPDAATRQEAVRVMLAAADFAGSLGAHLIIWPGVEGYNYHFQTDYAASWTWLIDGLGQVAARCAERGIALIIEPKSSAPAMQIFLRSVGMTLHAIHSLRVLGLRNVKVNLDWQHQAMSGEPLGECAALLAAEGLLGHLHANAGWGTLDDKNMVGTSRFMETLELAFELRRAGYGQGDERIGFDFYPQTEDALAAIRRSVLQWRFIEAVAARIDAPALAEARASKDAVRAFEIVYAALGA
jgi:xylose isomerase